LDKRSCSVYTVAGTNLRTLISILTLLSITACTDIGTSDWRQKYIDQEKRRIIKVTKNYEFDSGDYSLKGIDSIFETYNENGQKLGINNTHFYKYDTSGKLIAEEYCTRTCEKPGKEIYYYDNLNRLVKTIVVFSKYDKRVSARYYYNDKNLLIKKVIGNDSSATTESYTYNSLSRRTTKTKREYNTNVNKWLTIVDSMFYGDNNRLILKKRYHLGEDLLTISKYNYKDTLLISELDTTITHIQGYLPTTETVHHAYFFRTDYKYNLDQKVIEKVTTRPDYKTPIFKVTYEYR
jgi:hypothetical protein